VACPEPMFVVGGGGHAKVVIELIAERANYQIAGLIDNVKSGSVLGIPIIGTDADLPRLRRTGVSKAFVALGDNRVRLALCRRLQQHDFQVVNAISRAAVISSSAQLGVGVAVMAGVVVNAQCRIENFTILNTGVIIDHDNQIGEASHIAPGCTLAGRVTVGRLAFIGTGASIIPGISVGDAAIVGAGACVVRNIPPGAVALGVPARVVGQSQL